MKWIRKISGFLKIVLPVLVGIGLLGLIIAWLAGVFGEKIQPTKTAKVQRVLPPDAENEIEEVHEVVKDYFSEAVGRSRRPPGPRSPPESWHQSRTYASRPAT